MLLIQFSVVLSVVSFYSLAASAQSPLKSLGYVLQADRLAKSQAAAVQELAESNRDLIVIDAAYDGTSRWTKSDLDAIRAGKSGRTVVCYMSVGEAEDYRSYWKAEWDADKDGSPDANAPKFLNAENPDWEGNYKVKYWHQQWQEIILNEVEQIVAQGFDGVYLDIIDAIGAEDVFTNGKRPREQSEVKYRMGFLKKAIEANKPVYVIEYPKNERAKTAALDGAKAAGFSLLLTDRPLKTLGESGNP